MVAGCQIIVTTDSTEDLFEAASVSGNVVTLTTAATRGAPQGSRVNVAHWVRPPDSQVFAAETDMLWTANLRYDVVPGSSFETFKAAEGALYEGREVFLTKPNWRETPRFTFAQERDEFDPGQGISSFLAPHKADQLQLQLTYSAFTSAQADELISFFLRQRGRRNSFWMPTWSRDILPSAAAMPAANQFQIDGGDFWQVYADSPVYRRMIAFWPDGSHQINRVTEIAGSTNSFASFADNWVNSITPGTRIMWLPLWRFESDTLDVQWLTDSKAEMQFPVRTLFASDVENDSGGF